MREEGTVVAVEGDTARVRVQPGPHCGGCCACSMLGGGPPELELSAPEPLHVGDRVVVEVDTSGTTLGAVLVFVLPLLGLVAGVVVGHHARPFGTSGNAGGLILGFGLLLALFGMAMAVDRWFLRRRVAAPTIVRVIRGGGPGAPPSSGVAAPESEERP
ncbi:MAG: SoxR reducing system RseC family protein [Candidatus Brocadiia bacterium]